MLEIDRQFDCAILLTFGTTSLNQGFGERSSENQSAVEVSVSFIRVRISQSAIDDRENQHLLSGQDGFIQPCKCTPASGKFLASSSKYFQLAFSHSACLVFRGETLIDEKTFRQLIRNVSS